MKFIIVSEPILKILTGSFAAGITLWPFIFIRHPSLKSHSVFLNHEKIHLRQQAELLIVFFYLWYFTEYIVRWYVLKNKKRAYYQISFEREAYAKEADLEYLKKRKWFAFIKYIRIKP